MENLLYQIALTQIPRVGPVLARNLLSYVGSAEAVFKSSKKTLEKIPGIGSYVSKEIKSAQPLLAAEREVGLVQAHNLRAYFLTDAGYPERLRHLPDSPLLLFTRGNVDLNPRRSIGVIGTRMPSSRGLAICEELLAGLVPYGPMIVSGLAYGVDICAHRTAVQLELPTVGVLAHGLGYLYPMAHKQTAEKMEGNGGLVTEYLYRDIPERDRFPQRNRIVAGLCDALIVIETGIQGGSMITAHFANEYNKEVFAIPGRIQDSLSVGCNLLIKTHRAALLDTPEDVIQALRWEEEDQRKVVQKQLFVDLQPEEKIIVDLLREAEDISFDQLLHTGGFTSGQLASLLLDLEFQGMVRSLPGKRYALLSS